MSKLCNGSIITASALTSTFSTLMERPSFPIKELKVQNSADKDLVVALDGVEMLLPALSNGKFGDLAADFAFQPEVTVKHNGAAPTVGAIQAFGTGK